MSSFCRLEPGYFNFEMQAFGAGQKNAKALNLDLP
jgi:hypothetical protein